MAVRENFTGFLFNTKKEAYRALRIISLLASLAALSLLIYVYGFLLSVTEVGFIFLLLDLIFLVFLMSYLTRLLYSFERQLFLRRTWIEGLLVLFIAVNGFANYVFDYKILYKVSEYFQVGSPQAFYEIIITVYMSFLAVLEVSKASSSIILNSKLKPATAFLASFLLLIVLGTGALMLPEATTGPGSMALIDALFTATSASCVTGLAVEDTGTFFTFKGHLILLLLIQVGGLGIVTFATFFTALLNQNVGIKQQSLMQEVLSSESLFSTKGLFKNVIGLTLIIEFWGAVFIFFSWSDAVVFESLNEKLFYSLFHSISAFCNAGFSLFSNGLSEQGVATSYILHLVVAVIIILGGIGFNTLQDFSIPRLRERLYTPWKDWQIGTKIAIYTSAFLIVLGTIGFFLLEYQYTLKGMNLMERLITSFFQSVTTRTAGFNTVDISALSAPSVIMFLSFMFIGACPLSTGGGIKTTTIWLVLASMLANIRGKKSVDFGRRSIPNEIIARANAVFMIAVLYNFTAILALSICEPDLPILHLIFEQVSAFGTVGLSTGITAELGVGAKVVIMISMFLGRVGTVTLALAISKKVLSNAYDYPKGYLMVG